jgi:hypothetical protein
MVEAVEQVQDQEVLQLAVLAVAEHILDLQELLVILLVLVQVKVVQVAMEVQYQIPVVAVAVQLVLVEIVLVRDIPLALAE